MTDEEQIEAVAKAIFYASWPILKTCLPDAWGDEPARVRTRYRRIARAAIKAMQPRSKKP